jgi:putative membrane protein insertion efficiency factor
MSTLRKLLKRPHPWLVVTALLFFMAVMDIHREPGSQVLARVYVASVHAYQRIGRPILSGRIQCRYQPTCSEYSIEAVQRHGLIKGLRMTERRLASCTKAVPLGTVDPVAEYAQR